MDYIQNYDESVHTDSNKTITPEYAQKVLDKFNKRNTEIANSAVKAVEANFNILGSELAISKQELEPAINYLKKSLYDLLSNLIDAKIKEE